MNRTVVIGGVVAVAVLLGVAAWFLLSGKIGTSPTGEVAGEPQGPIALNPVTVVTDHAASESEDGTTLTVTFPNFELAAKAGETATAVFSTTWRLKLAEDQRAVVAAATLDGYMKSTGAPAPAPAPQPAATEPATAAAPAEGTPPAEGAAPAEGDAATTAAAEPAKPAAAPATALPVAGAGVARVIVTFGGETSVVEWKDTSGEGAPRRVAKALAFTGSSTDVRNGGKVPVTVTVEVSGGNAVETLARVSALNLRLFAESAPLPQPEPATPATAETPAEGAPAAEPSAETPPASGETATPPAEQPAQPEATTP